MRQLKNKIFGRLFTKYPALVNRWARRSKFVEFSNSPWTLLLTKAAHQCRLALVTTSGVHLKTQSCFDMKDPAGDPSFTLSVEITKKVLPSRAICPGFPLGHPIAFPGQPTLHLQILRLLLKHLKEIYSPGTVVKVDLTTSDDFVAGSPSWVSG